jgi:hypothetical protein
MGHRGVPKVLLEATLSGADDTWNRVDGIDLGDAAYRKVNLCFTARGVRGTDDGSPRLLRGSPAIESAVMRPVDDLPARAISDRERQLRTRQLQALGYID